MTDDRKALEEIRKFFAAHSFCDPYVKDSWRTALNTAIERDAKADSEGAGDLYRCSRCGGVVVAVVDEPFQWCVCGEDEADSAGAGHRCVSPYDVCPDCGDKGAADSAGDGAGQAVAVGCGDKKHPFRRWWVDAIGGDWEVADAQREHDKRTRCKRKLEPLFARQPGAGQAVAWHVLADGVLYGCKSTREAAEQLAQTHGFGGAKTSVEPVFARQPGAGHDCGEGGK